MPLQNRVTPFGDLVAIDARGAWMGNRGLLHDAERRICRPWRLKRWLICRLAFKERRRRVMTTGLYTELFFLDEATALAAGHRPCAECRRSDYQRYKAAAEAASGRRFRTAGELDEVLHDSRLAPDGARRLYRAEATSLPDGVFVAIEGEPWLLRGGALRRWTPWGYSMRRSAPVGAVEVLTPSLSVDAIQLGYSPQQASI